MLLFMDGQAHYASSDLARKYSNVNTASTAWAVVPEGRTANCIRKTTLDNTNIGYLDISPLMTRLGPWAPTASGVLGFAIMVDDLTRIRDTILMPNVLVRIVEGNSYHLRVCLTQAGTFTLVRMDASEGSSGPLVLALSAEGIASGVWAYVEFKWVIANVTGMFEIRVNGVTVLTYAGRTYQSGLAWRALGLWDTVRLLEVATDGIAPHVVIRISDLYLADLAAPLATDVHDFLGDGTVVTILPNAGGAVTGWTPSAAGGNWDQVNEPAPDDDATYVGATAPGTTDTYGYQNIPGGAIVKGAHFNILARKEGDGSASLAPVYRQGGVDYVGPTQGVVSTAYDRYLTQPYDVNPATDAPFTDGEINGNEFGVRKVI